MPWHAIIQGVAAVTVGVVIAFVAASFAIGLGWLLALALHYIRHWPNRR